MSRIEETKAKPERKKAARPLGVPADKLEVRNKQGGLHYAWCMERDLQAFLDATYEHVREGDPERVASSDMTGSAGGVGTVISTGVNRDGTRAFLMKLPLEEYEHQQELRNKESRVPLDAIQRGDDLYQFKGSYKPKR